MKDTPIIVIPDVHGHLLALERLLRYLEKSGYLNDHKLVFLGDYFDRGPYVKELIDLCVELQKDGHTFLCGNHEYVIRMMLTQHRERWNAWTERWMRNYEDGTLESYRINAASLTAQEAAKVFLQKLPDRHAKFILSLPLYLETDNAILIHAGIEKHQTWEKQRQSLDSDSGQSEHGPAQIFSMELARENFNPTPKKLITGHSVFRNPVIKKRRIMLNCGAEFGYPLAAWISSCERIIRVKHYNWKNIARRYLV